MSGASETGNRRLPDLSARAVACLYGESCGEPYAAKLAVASVIRNRMAAGWGLRGIYGASNRQLNHVDAKAWAACVRAWNESSTNNTEAGHLHFGGKLDDGWFAKHGMKLVRTISRTRIYQ